MKPVRLGVIGCGVIGQNHLRAATESPLLDVVAVADFREDAAREAADKFHINTVYADGSALIDAPDVEAVVLATPTAGRTKLALQAFARGRHVLIEKPVAMNVGEVRRMIKARGNLTAACCSSRQRFLEGAGVAADFIADGALGRLRVVRCRRIVPAGEPPQAPPPAWRLSRARNGGGILANWGCYDLDYLLGITGWKLIPRTVFAQTWTIPPKFESHVPAGSDAETHYAVMIRCEGGTVITMERGEYVSACADAAWQIIGTNGALTLTMTPNENEPKKIILDEASTENGVVTRTLWEGMEDARMAHAGPVTDFAAAIRENRRPKTGLEESLIIQQITDAIYASSEKGASVEIK